MVQLNRRTAAYVVDPERSIAGGGVRRGAAPVLIGRRRQLHDADQALDDVVDIGEVSLHAAVVEDVDRLACEYGLGEDEQGHVRSAPWSVDREEPQTSRGQPEKMAVGMGHQFVGLLAGGI